MSRRKDQLAWLKRLPRQPPGREVWPEHVADETEGKLNKNFVGQENTVKENNVQEKLNASFWATTVLGYCCCKNAHGLWLMSLLSQANENQLAFRNSPSWCAEILFVALTLNWPLTFDLASMAFRFNLLSYERLGLVALIVGSFQEMNEDAQLLQAGELIFSLTGWAPGAASGHTWETLLLSSKFRKLEKEAENTQSWGEWRETLQSPLGWEARLGVRQKGPRHPCADSLLLPETAVNSGALIWFVQPWIISFNCTWHLQLLSGI